MCRHRQWQASQDESNEFTEHKLDCYDDHNRVSMQKAQDAIRMTTMPNQENRKIHLASDLQLPKTFSMLCIQIFQGPQKIIHCRALQRLGPIQGRRRQPTLLSFSTIKIVCISNERGIYRVGSSFVFISKLEGIGYK